MFLSFGCKDTNNEAKKQKILSVFERELRMQRLEFEHEQNFILTEKTKDLNTKNG
jgi:hypothetical protein